MISYLELEGVEEEVVHNVMFSFEHECDGGRNEISNKNLIIVQGVRVSRIIGSNSSNWLPAISCHRLLQQIPSLFLKLALIFFLYRFRRAGCTVLLLNRIRQWPRVLFHNKIACGFDLGVQVNPLRNSGCWWSWPHSLILPNLPALHGAIVDHPALPSCQTMRMVFTSNTCRRCSFFYLDGSFQVVCAQCPRILRRKTREEGLLLHQAWSMSIELWAQGEGTLAAYCCQRIYQISAWIHVKEAYWHQSVNLQIQILPTKNSKCNAMRRFWLISPGPIKQATWTARRLTRATPIRETPTNSVVLFQTKN